MEVSSSSQDTVIVRVYVCTGYSVNFGHYGVAETAEMHDGWNQPTKTAENTNAPLDPR